MRLSVVVLNYKVPQHLMLCLDSVSKAIADIEAEIIVVDNNSEDESCRLVSQNFPEVVLIENKENSGFSKGNNIGVRKAKGEFLCILNPDTIVPEDCFKKLLNYYKSVENPGIIGTQLIDGSGEFLKESKRNIPTPKVALKKLIGNCKPYYNSTLTKDKNGPTGVLVGAFMFMKTDLYLSTGGFDEDYFMYGEDIDLSYRVMKAGFQNYYCGNIKVLHFKGESTTKDQIYLNRFFNAIYIFYKKHYKNYKTTFNLAKQSLKLTMLIEKNKLKSIRKVHKVFKNIHLISKDKCLYDLVSKQSAQSQVNLISEINLELNDSMIILDANLVDYKKCIQIASKLKSKNNAFRFKPRNHKFMVGSESKYLKGEVIHLS